jgi:hypothetical protein
MTHASLGGPDRHDTLTGMTGRSGRGTARQTIRVDETLWERFGEATEALGTDRSTWLREAIAWCVRERGAKMPRRLDESASPQVAIRSYTDGVAAAKPKGTTWHEFWMVNTLDPAGLALLDLGGIGIDTGGRRIFGQSLAAVRRAYDALKAAGYAIVNDED